MILLHEQCHNFDFNNMITFCNGQIQQGSAECLMLVEIANKGTSDI